MAFELELKAGALSLRNSPDIAEMVFCYRNCFDLSTVRKNYQEKLLKFDAEGREFAKFLRSLEQFIILRSNILEQFQVVPWQSEQSNLALQRI